MSKFQEYSVIYGKVKKYFDVIFLILFGLKYILQFLTTTAVWISALGAFYSCPYKIADFLFIGYLVFHMMVTLVFEKVELKDKVISFVLIIVAFLYVALSDSSDNEIFEYMIIIAIALNKPSRMMLKLSIIEGTVIMVIFMLLSQAGVIEDYVMPVGRHALGMIYCTDCGAHLLFLVLSYVIYKKYECDKKMLVLLIFIMSIECCIINSKTATICSFLLILGLLIGRYKKKILIYLKYPMLFVFPLSFALFICMVYFNIKFPGVMPNNTFTARLYLTEVGIRKYGISLWGKLIYQNGNGGGSNGEVSINEITNDNNHLLLVLFAILVLGFIILTLIAITARNRILTLTCFLTSLMLIIIPRVVAKFTLDTYNGGKEFSSYFYLDNSFINVLLRQGIVVFLIMMVIGTYMQYKACCQENYMMMYIMCIVALECMMEHHLMDLSYNVIFILALSDVYIVDSKNN